MGRVLGYFPQHSFHTSLCFINLHQLCFTKLCKLVVRLFIYVIGRSKQRNFRLFPHQCFLLFGELSWLGGSNGQKYSPPHWSQNKRLPKFWRHILSVFYHADGGVRCLKRWVINLPGCKILCPRRPLPQRFMCTWKSPCVDVRMMIVRPHNLQMQSLCARELSVSIFLPLFDPGKSYPKPAVLQIICWDGIQSLLWRWYTRLTDLSGLIRSKLHFFQT